MISRLVPEDTTFAADLHARALPHGFFVMLGERFLRAYYRCFVDSPAAVALVAHVDGTRAGVLVGTVDDGAHYRFVVRRCWWRLAPWALIGLASRPAVATRFLRTRARRYARGFVRLARRSGPATPVESAASAGVLTHIAVAEGARGAGVGAALVDAYVDAARVRGASLLRTVTLADDAGAGGFYERQGWQPAQARRDLDGRVWSTYTLDP